MVLEVVGSWGFVAEILLKTKNLQTTLFYTTSSEGGRG